MINGLLGQMKIKKNIQIFLQVEYTFKVIAKNVFEIESKASRITLFKF